jgi:molybdate transport system substrate-binding protein
VRPVRRVSVLGLLVSLFATSLPSHAANKPSPPLLVFAASSLTDAMDQIAAAYIKSTGQQVNLSYAASSVLARQVEAGAKADVFFSADTDWMDFLQARGLVDKGTRKDLLGNRLVLVAPANSNVSIRIAPNFALAAALDSASVKARLATGDSDSVPVGRYARMALSSLGIWKDVENRLIRADNVRSALSFIARGEAPLGIVYETDAIVDKKVRIVDTFPASTHPPIIYPVAATAGAQAPAKRFVTFLQGEAAQAVFKKYGFSTLHSAPAE